MKKISVIGPLFNEQVLVEKFCNEVVRVFRDSLNRYRLELILVDDGSSDNTYTEMLLIQQKYPKMVSTVRLSRNFGLEGALQAGLEASTGDAVVVMDADLQDPPSIIIDMVEHWERGIDIVSAVRHSRPSDSYFKRVTARIYYNLLDSLSGKIKLDRDAANFRLLDRKAVNLLLQLPEVNSVFRVSVPFLGLKTAVVSYERDKRYAGETKYNFKSMFSYALDGLTGISITPLRKVYLSVVIAGGVTSFTLVMSLLSNQNGTSYLILSVVSFLLTLVLVVLSLIAEYLAQIFIEVKHRPTFIVEKSIRTEDSDGD